MNPIALRLHETGLLLEDQGMPEIVAVLGIAEREIERLEDLRRPPPGRTPVWVQCQPCGHKWIGLYTPMQLSAVGRVMLSLCCPMCGTGSKQIHKVPAP